MSAHESRKKKTRPPVKILGLINPEEIFTSSSYLTLESDRGCVLVAGAAIDEALVRLLKAFFKKASAPHDRSEWATFLIEKQPVPPLGSFGIRAILCFALGLIEEEDFKAIRHLADTRNTFAHFAKTLEILSNDVPPIVIHGDQDAIKEAKAKLARLFENIRTIAESKLGDIPKLGESKHFSEARLEFMVTVATLLQAIATAERKVTEANANSTPHQ